RPWPLIFTKRSAHDALICVDHWKARCPIEARTMVPLSEQYHMPTHLLVQDVFTFPVLGFSLTMTAREGFVLLVGWNLAFVWWRDLAWLPSAAGTTGLLMQYAIVLLVAILTLIISKFKLADRYLEEWVGVLWRYAHLSRVYCWRSALLPADPLSVSLPIMHEEVE
ncbi:MAG: hypothetical protein J2P37_34060, partial [Ktedonobacteraceae bacterium]|nr:hypothetical protein [Ktedonobacteraceae bacterium]